jgi:site-specific DNA recombinase
MIHHYRNICRIFLCLSSTWKLQGERDSVIISKLEKLGVKLNLKQIGKIFRNPFYCGVSINKMLDTPVKGNWEPMISQTNFLKIQGIIKPSKVGTYQVSSTDENRPLARFLVCANCESYLTGYEVKNKKIHYYKCPKCNGVNMNVSSTKQSRNKGINDHFIEMLRTITLKPEAKAPFNELMKRLFKDLNGDTINEIHEQNNSIQDLKNKLMNLEEKYLYDNAIDKDVYLKHRANLEAKIWEAEQNVAESASLSSNFDEYLLKATEVCENLSQYWVSGDHDNKQRIQKMLFPEGLVVVPVSRVLLTDNLNQIFKLIPCLESVSEGDKKEKASKNADLSLSVARRRLELPTSGL